MCDAKIRPLPLQVVELQCEDLFSGQDHVHYAILRDYAYPGSATRLTWMDNDRRTYRGEWAPCHLLDGTHNLCTLPAAHHGTCAP